MSLRSNGSYIGPRPTGPSSSVASGIWDLRTVERQRAANNWPGQPVPDPNFASVSLLLHMDGSGATFIDSSGSPKTVTAVGNATQSETQSRFGGKAAYFDGDGDYLTVPYSSAFNLQSGDFTVEVWVRFASLKDFQDIIRINRGGTNNLYHQLGIVADSAGGIYMLAGTSSDNWVSATPTSSGVVTAGTWHYIAVTRSGSNLTLYVDGSSVLTQSYSGSLVNFSGQSEIGANAGSDSVDRRFSGYIDEVRVTKGVARTVTSVPTAAFPDA